jgi:hypothetical protein
MLWYGDPGIDLFGDFNRFAGRHGKHAARHRYEQHVYFSQQLKLWRSQQVTEIA